MRGLAISPPRFSKYCKIAIRQNFLKKKLAGDLGLEPLDEGCHRTAYEEV
jgi:hypothetical protein